MIIGKLNPMRTDKMRLRFRSSHREFFHINIDKYSALYLASKASAFLLYLFIYVLYNNRAINSNLQGSIEKEINYET